ncbi:hypothetical protein [Amycolatopsis sp. 195334CR]|uniref:hypothetical protein n=1 Tax=Amycolatopsis sp. 195334CR TaxID=2814588 RepID=UPI001A8C58B1|nr:hypothetical protein [Amycolatopsis sp. 195334CR]MBN6041208.1 hypothetical protein [Amycolatopsis sp. 195334CR]
MSDEWPLAPGTKPSFGLLADVDTSEMPHAEQFAASLEALANRTTEVYSSVPGIVNIEGEQHELHIHGELGVQPTGSSSISVAYHAHLEMALDVEYVGSVIDHLGTTPEHFMAFAQVLSGQHIAMSDTGYLGPDSEGYAPPIDFSYYHLAFFKVSDGGTPSGDVKEALADHAALNRAQQAIVMSDWDSTAKEAAMEKFVGLMNFLIYLRGPMYAELGATLVTYATLVKAARKQLDGLMAQADAAMRRLDAHDPEPGKVLGTLLTLAGFIPGLPYAIAFGIGVASAVVSAIESKAKVESSEKITIPADRSASCVDILSWFLEKARDTCEELAVGIQNLTKRLPELLDEVAAEIPKEAYIQPELRTLPA